LIVVLDLAAATRVLLDVLPLVAAAISIAHGRSNSR
jgi:hypothetical protein